MDTPLWKPTNTDLKQSHMAQFINFVNQQQHLSLSDYQSLYKWSITEPNVFWEAVWHYCKIIAEQPAKQAFIAGKTMRDATWFSGAKLNFALNLLSRRDNHPAIIYACENGERATLSYQTLYQKVINLVAHLKQLGIQPGDRIAGFLPNRPETIIAMLATTYLGAIWSSCSPDFGLQGLLDRFAQIEPAILLATTAHSYNGKTHHHLSKIKSLQEKLPSLKQTIVISHIEKADISALKNAIFFEDIPDSTTTIAEPEHFPFNHPAFILYSSGTTGIPKCMVHGAGNVLIQHLKELMLHTDLHPNDKIFFYTTCGWMMWNWLVSSLAVGATVVLYEGSPVYPNSNTLFDLIDEVGITIFGVGAKLLETAENYALVPMKTHSLKSLRCILTTGSPLLPQSFDYVYQKVKSSVRLSSISGGSDIVSCFVLGNPILPVYRGEIQSRGLGMDVQVYNDHGESVIDEKGELVCTLPFPSMPLYFWNDPNGEKYFNAYFKRFSNVWAHGDYALLTHHDGVIIFGRSDATLNPGGIRIGTAEIYREVEHFPQIIDCLATAQRWQGSERIILFVVMKENESLNNELIKSIKTNIRNHISPHHVPAKIIAVPDLPRTISGKTVELAVKNIIHGKPVKNISALANPETLDYFKDLNELEK